MRKSVTFLSLSSLGISSCLLFGIPNLANASYSTYTCPNTYRNVQVGDSMNTVKAACGAPSSEVTHEAQVTTPITTTQWVYTLGNTKVKGVEVYLATIVVTLRDQRAIKIERGGLPITTGGYCAINGTISVGDSAENILSTCGRPNYVNTLQDTVTSTKEVTDLTYNSGPYKPQIIFTFEKGLLAQINTGGMGN